MNLSQKRRLRLERDDETGYEGDVAEEENKSSSEGELHNHTTTQRRGDRRGQACHEVGSRESGVMAALTLRGSNLR